LQIHKLDIKKILQVKHYSIILSTVGFFFFLGFSNLRAEDEKILSFEEHCVAYTTPEKILFFSEYLVIGKSCNVKAWVENYEKKLKFKVKIPVDSFNSGISARDDDVMEILKAKHYPNILFETDWLSEDEVKKTILDGQGIVNGVLTVSGRDYSISFNLIIYRKIKNYSFRATLDSNYNFFKITPPKLGIFAKVFNSIKIVVNLQSDQIIGFEKVINLKN